MQLFSLRLGTCSSRCTSPPKSAKVIRFKAPVDAGRASRRTRLILARLQGSAGWRIIGGMPALRRTLVATFATAGMAIFAPAIADDAGSFFAGKTVRVVVGFSPGGGYDIYARELARYLGRHIPGHLAVVVQNMAGAGSLKAVNFLFNAAPRDGTALATFSRGIVFEPLIGHLDGAQFEAPKFNWIGSISDETGVC